MDGARIVFISIYFVVLNPEGGLSFRQYQSSSQLSKYLPGGTAHGTIHYDFLAAGLARCPRYRDLAVYKDNDTSSS